MNFYVRSGLGGGPISWLVRSPVLNPVDFYVWGHRNQYFTELELIISKYYVNVVMKAVIKSCTIPSISNTSENRWSDVFISVSKLVVILFRMISLWIDEQLLQRRINCNLKTKSHRTITFQTIFVRTLYLCHTCVLVHILYVCFVREVQFFVSYKNTYNPV